MDNNKIIDSLNITEYELEKMDLYIPENPFLNNQDRENFKINLVLIPNAFFSYDYFIDFIYYKGIDVLNDFRILYFLPFPDYFHICNLKFIKIRTKEEFKKNFVCLKHNYPYEKFCDSHYSILCSKCDPCCEYVNYIHQNINWEIFENNRIKTIKIIKKLITEFFCEQLSEFTDNDFCKIESENIFIQKVEKLINKEIDIGVIKKLKLLILDLNSVITSIMKIFNSKKYFSIYNRYNLHFFKDIFYPTALEPVINDSYFLKEMKYYFYDEKSSFKEMIISTLKNFDSLEKYMHDNTKSKDEQFVLLRRRIIEIKKIKNSEYFFVIFSNGAKIFDYKSNCILEISRTRFELMIQISKNYFIYRNANMHVLYLEYDLYNVPKKVVYLNNENLINNIRYPYAMNWIEDKNILIILFDNNTDNDNDDDDIMYLNFYYISFENNKLKCDICKKYNLNEELNLSMDDMNNYDYVDNYGYKLIIDNNKTNLLFMNLESKSDETIYLNINIIELNNFTITKKLNLKFGDLCNYDTKIINENHLMIIKNNGKIINYSLRTYEIVNIYNDIFTNIEENFYTFKTFFFNGKEVLIFNNCDLNIFEINTEYEMIEIKNNERYKYFDKFRSKRFNLDYVEKLDNGMYAICYREILNFFNERIIPINKIEIIKL